MQKGEVRRLADAFPVAEIQRASEHIDEQLRSHEESLRGLRAYLRDNQQLSKLVQELPNKVSHRIMVPFGRAAFFPGRLVHTNEFLVLLGEGYYAERSAKQTLELLDRRSKYLNTQIAAVNNQIEDLHAESSFFNDTLAEAAAGVVEIREDIMESSSDSFAQGSERDLSRPIGGRMESLAMVGGQITRPVDVDLEHERLMARLDELEAAEAAAEKDVESGDENDNLENIREHGAMPDASVLHDYESSKQAISRECPVIQSPADFLKFEEWRRCNYAKSEVSVPGSISERQAEGINVSNHPAPRGFEMQNNREDRTPVIETPKSVSTSRTQKAFSGTVLERVGPSLPVETFQELNPLYNRPTSKFKMRQQGK